MTETTVRNVRKKTHLIMRHLGFTETECGRYVVALRNVVTENVEKGMVNWRVVFHPWAAEPNRNNEERARYILAQYWNDQRGYTAQLNGKYWRIPNQLRILRMRYRVWRDRLLGIRNPYCPIPDDGGVR